MNHVEKKVHYKDLKITTSGEFSLKLATNDLIQGTEYISITSNQ